VRSGKKYAAIYLVLVISWVEKKPHILVKKGSRAVEDSEAKAGPLLKGKRRR
jgi:hypothetical protein